MRRRDKVIQTPAVDQSDLSDLGTITVDNRLISLRLAGDLIMLSSLVTAH